VSGKASVDALLHRMEGQIAHDRSEPPHPLRQRLQHGQRDLGMLPAQRQHVRPWHEHHATRDERDRGRDVAAAIEEWALAQGGARPLRVEDLLATAQRDLEHLDAARRHDEEAGARRAFLEERLARGQRARAAAPRERAQLRGRERAKIRQAAEQGRVRRPCVFRGPCTPWSRPPHATQTVFRPLAFAL